MTWEAPRDVDGQETIEVGPGLYLFSIDDAQYGLSKKGSEFLLFKLSSKHGMFNHWVSVVDGKPKTTNQQGQPTSHHSRQLAQILRACDYPDAHFWKDPKDSRRLPDLDSDDGKEMLRSLLGKELVGHIGSYQKDSSLVLLSAKHKHTVDPSTIGPIRKQERPRHDEPADDDVPF